MLKSINIKDLSKSKEIAEDGSIHVSYNVAGRPCIVRVLDSRTAMQAASAQGLAKDMELVIVGLEYAIHLLDNTSFTFSGTFPDSGSKDRVISNLFLSAIVTYCKGFSQAEGRNLKLQDSEIKKIFSIPQIDLHNRIRNWRNTWTAHAGNTKMESSKCIQIKFDTDEPMGVCLFSHTSFRFHSERDELVSFLDMAKILHSRYAALVREKSAIVNEERKSGVFDHIPFSSYVVFNDIEDAPKKKST